MIQTAAIFTAGAAFAGMFTSLFMELTQEPSAVSPVAAGRILPTCSGACQVTSDPLNPAGLSQSTTITAGGLLANGPGAPGNSPEAWFAWHTIL